MGLDKFENKECFCTFISALGPFKQELLSLITLARGMLEMTKAGYMMTNFSFEDEARKIVLQAGLDLAEAVLGPIEAPLLLLESQTKPWADCPPVQNLSTIFKNVRGIVTAPLEEIRFELKQLEHEISSNTRTNAKIDRMIELMDEFASAIQEC